MCCNGVCGSALGLILHCCKHVIKSGKSNYHTYPTDCTLCTKSQTSIDYVEAFEKYFWNYDDQYRQCLIDNFEKLGCIEYDNCENGFKQIYNELKDENIVVSGQIWAKKMQSFFYDLLFLKFDSILNRLANLSCKYNTLTLREDVQILMN